MNENSNTYVTYKWLFATAVSLLVITLGFVYFAFSNINTGLGNKADIKWVETRTNVDSGRIDALCTKIEKMEDKQDALLKELYAIKALLIGKKAIL
jgi:hypothetical protein